MKRLDDDSARAEERGTGALVPSNGVVPSSARAGSVPMPGSSAGAMTPAAADRAFKEVPAPAASIQDKMLVAQLEKLELEIRVLHRTVQDETTPRRQLEKTELEVKTLSRQHARWAIALQFVPALASIATLASVIVAALTLVSTVERNQRGEEASRQERIRTQFMAACGELETFAEDATASIPRLVAVVQELDAMSQIAGDPENAHRRARADELVVALFREANLTRLRDAKMLRTLFDYWPGLKNRIGSDPVFCRSWFGLLSGGLSHWIGAHRAALEGVHFVQGDLVFSEPIPLDEESLFYELRYLYLTSFGILSSDQEAFALERLERAAFDLMFPAAADSGLTGQEGECGARQDADADGEQCWAVRRGGDGDK